MRAIVPGRGPARPPAARVESPRSPFLPLVLLAAAWLAWTAFQTVQLVVESSSLDAAHGQQESLVQNATKLRQSLDSIAAQTQRLADLGNPNAKSLVEELRKRGVTINAAGGTTASAPGASVAGSR